jgi:hypothetical protein
MGYFFLSGWTMKNSDTLRGAAGVGAGWRAQLQIRSLTGQERGRTIPLPVGPW